MLTFFPKKLSQIYWMCMTLFLVVFMIGNAFYTSRQFYRNVQIQFLEKTQPSNIELCYFDNGLCGFWWNSDRQDIVSCIIVFCGHICDFYSYSTNYFALQKLFPSYQILYLESCLSFQQNKGLSFSTWTKRYQEIIENMNRFQKWNHLSFIGLDSGCLMTLSLSQFIKPKWMLCINSPKQIESVPWLRPSLSFSKLLQQIPTPIKQIPLLLVHTRHNPRISFLESYAMYQTLHQFQYHCRWKLFHGIYDQCFLSIENRQLIRDEFPFLMIES